MVTKDQELRNIRPGIKGSSFVLALQDGNPRYSKCVYVFDFGSEAFSKQTHVPTSTSSFEWNLLTTDV